MLLMHSAVTDASKEVSESSTMTMVSEEAKETTEMTTTEEHEESTVVAATVTPLENEVSHRSFATIDEPKGRALNFTVEEEDPNNVILSNSSSYHHDYDLSEVPMDHEDEFDVVKSKILAPKFQLHNSTLGICEKGGLTYENGEKLELGCDSVCTCRNGKMDCAERCASPFFRKGKKIEDPLCSAKEADDPCCSVLVCTGDTETEPLEICSYENATYNRGDKFNKECAEVCTCEAAGKITCKARCLPISKTSDRCVEVPDPNDPCCKKVLCDVTLEDHDSEKDDEKPRPKLLSAKYVNSTAIMLTFDSKFEENESLPDVEVSNDQSNWTYYRLLPGDVVFVKDHVKYLKVENAEEVVEVDDSALESVPSVEVTDNTFKDCQYKDRTFKIGEEYNDNCEFLCICLNGHMKCLKIECPTYFGVDVLDANCVEWETVPPNFSPSPPNCCPEKVRCKDNGSCDYEGRTYKNWDELPSNVTGCEKKCYCEMGKVECQNTCPPVTALPPPNLPCPPHMATISHTPNDDCCKEWVCNTETTSPESILSQLSPSPEPPKPPKFTFATHSPVTERVTSKPSKIVHNKAPNKNASLFITPPPQVEHNNNENYIPNDINPHTPFLPTQPPPVQSEINIHTHSNPEELLQFIHQHPEISNYPSGSVLEFHNVPHDLNGNPLPHTRFFLKYTLCPTWFLRILQIHTYQTPFLPGYLCKIYWRSFKRAIPSKIIPCRFIPIRRLLVVMDLYLSRDPVDLYYLTDIISPRFIQDQEPWSPGPSPRFSFEFDLNLNENGHSGDTHGDMYPGNFPGFPNPPQQEEVIIQSLEAMDPHTVRLSFSVPPIIVGLHGRVEVRYTHDKSDDDMDSWMLTVFAPPNDLIATPSLVFNLMDLKADTLYKVKVTVTLRDLQNTPTSRIHTITTPKEYELSFIDGLQLRYKEIDGRIFTATPLIHRAETKYTLEKLKPNTKYEIGIYFIPFPGQMTELRSENMLHFTTANEIDTYGFNVTLELAQIKSQSIEISWSGVPYPEDKYVNIYRVIYQSDSGKEDQSTFKMAKRDSPARTLIKELKPGTRYRIWLEVYLTNGKIKMSNVEDFVTKPRVAPALGSSTQQDKLSRAEVIESKGDYYGPLVIVAILAAIAILSTLVLLLILVRRHNQNKAAITPPSTRISQSAYDNPTYKVEIQQETMGKFLKL
ncbi:hypothetical protein NQ318_004038 [Aromia moschata]|uniref:Epidermal cell surface receptor n=1 Tax=Aromia moschata TaxID=1265417 RepID=A0AAV8Z9U4_9CUCU|nr:hypothetical protein NQ318_004038 [Aromia moschata]